MRYYVLCRIITNVAPIFKKGRLQAENLPSVCLTCITCKLFEHIIYKHISSHLEDHKSLTDIQHGPGQEDHVKLN